MTCTTHIATVDVMKTYRHTIRDEDIQVIDDDIGGHISVFAAVHSCVYIIKCIVFQSNMNVNVMSNEAIVTSETHHRAGGV